MQDDAGYIMVDMIAEDYSLIENVNGFDDG
jgi:hypothetical protein